MGQALYRKYRSKSLDEVVGQEHVTTTLRNALKAGRISHAYLLSGPRGTGKTSIARILAHEINGLPYGDEAHLDVIEIDAASNRRIDEIRELRDRVNTAPAHAKYKVYIIDEVHMLTKEAFNALLKTLEEPPAHVIFILATTEAHKLPETIVSRTQRYSLRPVPLEQVAAHLRTIAKGEKLKIDDDALALIAQHGEGSFRDSISLLDQASSTASHVTKADVERILGLAPDEYIARLAGAVTTGDSAAIVTTLSGLYTQGFEPAMVSHQLSASLRETVLAGQATNPHASLELLQKLLDVPAARSPKQLLEIVLLQSALPVVAAPAQPVAPSVRTEAPEPTSAPAEPPRPAIKAVPKHAPEPSPEPPAEEPRPDAAPDATTEPAPESAQPEETSEQTVEAPAKPANLTDVTELWQQTLDEIKKQYNTLYGIARMARPEFDGHQLTLIMKFAFHQKRLNEAKNRKIFADVIERLYGQPVEIVCVTAEPGAAAAPAETGKPDVSAISNIFGGAELLES
jgi:DNA polymerase-3 subunit gamma/tau